MTKILAKTVHNAVTTELTQLCKKEISNVYDFDNISPIEVEKYPVA